MLLKMIEIFLFHKISFLQIFDKIRLKIHVSVLLFRFQVIILQVTQGKVSVGLFYRLGLR